MKMSCSKSNYFSLNVVLICKHLYRLHTVYKNTYMVVRGNKFTLECKIGRIHVTVTFMKTFKFPVVFASASCFAQFVCYHVKLHYITFMEA